MVTTGKVYSAVSDDEPLYGTRCIVSTCNKPILEVNSSEKVCTSCKQAAKNATTKLKAMRLKPKIAETGLWTPRSEASPKLSNYSDTMSPQQFPPLPSMAVPNDEGRKRKLGTEEEIQTWQNAKFRKLGGATEGNSEADSADQGSEDSLGSESSLSVSEGSPDPNEDPDYRGRKRKLSTEEGIQAWKNATFQKVTSKSPCSVSKRGYLRSGGPFSVSEGSPGPDETLYRSESPASVSLRSDGPLSGSQCSPRPEGAFSPLGSLHSASVRSPLRSESPDSAWEDFSGSENAFPLSESPRSASVRGSFQTESPDSAWENFSGSENAFSLSENSILVPKPLQHDADNIYTTSTNQSPKNRHRSWGDQLIKPLSMPCKGSNMLSTLQSAFPADTARRQQPKGPVILPGGGDFTDNGIVQFQSFVPFIGVTPDSIKPTLNPDSVQARRSKNPLETDSNALSFYDMLSKYRGSEEESTAKALFDSRTKDQSYISIQAKIAARGGRKKQFGEVLTRLDVDPTCSKHQNQLWKTNPAALNRDDLPLHKIYGEFKAEDMIPIVIDGELHLTQRQGYEGTRRTWRYGDGGAGKEQGYPEAQAGAWKHLAKAPI